MTRLSALSGARLMAVVVPLLWLDPALFTGAPAPVSTGMVYAIDPDTGLPGMPTPQQMRELAPAGTRVHQTTQGFVVEERPNGTVLIHVGWAMQEYSFARIGPDGRLIRGCASGHGLHAPVEIPAAVPLFEEK